MDCLEIHERAAKEIQDFVESVRYPKGLNSVRRVKSKVKSQAGGNHAASTGEAVKIVVIQLANYTLAFFMWMIAGKFCSPFIRNKENIMNKFFVKFTDPLYNIRRLIPFAKRLHPALSIFLLYSSVFYL